MAGNGPPAFAASKITPPWNTRKITNINAKILGKHICENGLGRGARMRRPSAASRVLLAYFGALMLGGSYLQVYVRGQAPLPAAVAKTETPTSATLAKYCVSCHNAKLK